MCVPAVADTMTGDVRAELGSPVHEAGVSNQR